jgi:hypothetical protein
MKKLIPVFLSIFFSVSLFAQQTEKKIHTPDPAKKVQLVETACGQCQFKMEGSGCDLAVRIKDKTYYVSGTSINDHGDAHAKDGFCNAVRKAEVQGEVKDNKFHATYFKLVKKEKGTKGEKGEKGEKVEKGIK